MRLLFPLLLLLCISTSLAQVRLDRLPAGTQPVEVNNQTYFYKDGYFYRKGPDAYTRVEPPLGARVSRVPIGTAFSLGRRRYILAGNGTFFLLDHKDGKYVVVTPPANWQHINRNPLAPKKKIYPRAYPPGYSFNRPGTKKLNRRDRELYCEARAANLLRRTTRPGKVSESALRQYRKAYRRCLRRRQSGR
ncbi:hypothetical protein MO867_10080 [Microbulbifer sp. OS29]|uniref:Uncharacterized protein n=1 Tax=Microbulbifer okhotskensis TaxID=2926617 RepID=A0A9X2ELZ4_9GAMM|nr:DUF6515 family protein [Microbulbifer okhotskensis]MCO1334687.1 hypothetical protein [Microbulbifer okhotskensis]